MFSEIFKRHTSAEFDAAFNPKSGEVQTGWPRPWLFSRVFLFLAGIYIAFLIVVSLFQRPQNMPALIVIGSLVVPLTMAVLFFELNIPRNVSFIRVLILLCSSVLAGILSSLVYDAHLPDWLGYSDAGIIEEIAKIAVIFLFLRKRPYPYILNGVLFGAAVGAGFSTWENAAFAFREFISHSQFTLDLDSVISMIHYRALTALGMHVVWTAIAAGALWKVKGNGSLKVKTLFKPSFLVIFLIPIALHMTWNLQLPEIIGKLRVVLGLVGWIVVLALVKRGLKQVEGEQEKTRQLISEQLTPEPV